MSSTNVAKKQKTSDKNESEHQDESFMDIIADETIDAIKKHQAILNKNKNALVLWIEDSANPDSRLIQKIKNVLYLAARARETKMEVYIPCFPNRTTMTYGSEYQKYDVDGPKREHFVHWTFDHTERFQKLLRKTFDSITVSHQTSGITLMLDWKRLMDKKEQQQQ